MKYLIMLFLTWSLLSLPSCVFDQTEVIPESFDNKLVLIELTNLSNDLNCSNGGVRLTTGQDTNFNQLLDSMEIGETFYFCNHTNGDNNLSMVKNVDASDICDFGGVKLITGNDKNDDGTLNESEIEDETYFCYEMVNKKHVLLKANEVFLPNTNSSNETSRKSSKKKSRVAH